MVLAALLEAEGYSVAVAGRGEQAVALATQQAFDLVVADIRMEGLDGLDAVAGVRELQPDVRALVVTGYSTEADSIRAIRLGVGDYLKKPFDLGDFLQSVARLVAERRQQENQRQRERTLLNTLRQALFGLARSLDMVNPERAIVATGQNADRLAQSLGLSPESRMEIELACLISAISDTGIQSFAHEELPAGVVRILSHLEECFDGSGGPGGLRGEEIPLEARVASVALAAARKQDLDSRFDPRVVAALESRSESRDFPDSGSQKRGLLALGRALEAAGDLAGADQAYRLATGNGREGVEGLLGLARLAQRQGQTERVAELALQARDLALQVSPLVTATTLLELGLLPGGGGSLEHLRQAGRIFQSLRLPAGEARALLALRALGEELALPQIEAAVAVLMAPEQSAELAASVPWLLPIVLAEANRGSQLLDRAGTRLVREFPRELHRQLSQGKLPTAARVFAAQALGAGDSPAARLLAADGEAAVRAALKPAEGPPPVPLLRIHSLGAFEVFRGEEAVEEGAWRGQKTKFLLAFLASQAGRPVSEDVLIDHFWPDELEKGRRSLYWSSSVLRRCLRPSGSEWESLDYLPRSGASLRLNPDLPRWHDWEELQQRAAEATRQQQAGRADLALDSYRRVVSLYRGPYLESCYMDWTDPLRQQAQDLVTRALSALIEGAQAGERPLEVLEHSQRLLELDNCRQEAALAAMQALTALGRPEEAVRRYESFARVLRRELDMEPGIPLFEAYQRARLAT